jgi:ubiquinone/menaquinone biosynthesis C-methylase UbiE
MQRVLEPEVMDTEEDAAEYDAMDFSEPNARFADDAIALLGPHGTHVLDVGTGPGHIPILLLARRPELRIVATDLARSMLDIAARNLARAGVADRCELRLADAKALPLPDASFDLVICNSTVHHVAEPVRALREIGRVVRPGGAILVRDLCRPESVEAAWATVERVSPRDSPRQKRLFFDSLRAALTLEEVCSCVREAGLEGVHVALASDRHWTCERAARDADAQPSR